MGSRQGSLRNKAILVPAALAISAFAPWAITRAADRRWPVSLLKAPEKLVQSSCTPGATTRIAQSSAAR